MNAVPSMLAVDIGGANLKYAHSSGQVFSRPFALWKSPFQLANALKQDIEHFPVAQTLLVTMTGELADCFFDRRQGIRFIASAVIEAFDGEVLFYGLDGAFHPTEHVHDDWECFTASNWHATASVHCRRVDGPSLLIDMGSTTTDIIPMTPSKIECDARTDTQRIENGCLFYFGDRRTPVFGVTSQVTIEGQTLALIPEWFATVDDVRICLGYQEPNTQDRETTDGNPRTFPASATRLLRSVGLDLQSADESVAIEIANQIHKAAVENMDQAIKKVCDRFPCEGSRVLRWVGRAVDLLPTRWLDGGNDKMGKTVVGDSDNETLGPCRSLIELFQTECLK